MRTAVLGLVGLAVGGAGLACQSYNMEGVDPQTVIAVGYEEIFTAGKAPALLIVQDRSGSMQICFGDGEGEPGQRCDANGDNTLDTDGTSRMHIAQRVMSDVVDRHGNDVYFGLALYGVGGENPSCGDPQQVAAPGPGTKASVIGAYQDNPAITQPAGGTPTTTALQLAFDTLVDASTGKVKKAERDNYVVLVTDGLMNCNFDHPMPCICANESGCITEDGSGQLPFGTEGTFLDGRFCLDDDNSIAAVTALRNAGVKTFVIGLGDSFSGGSADLGVMSLNALAEAGGVARSGEEKFYSAADEMQLQESLETIIAQIQVPCEYELDGPVCDGRLVSITMQIDGKSVPTTCGEGDESWQYIDEQNITFSDDLCRRFEQASQVKISIKGIESGCGAGESPTCNPHAP